MGSVYENVANYDLLSTIMICLGSKTDERYTGILKLLDVWLSRNSIEEKRAVLKDIFHAEMPVRLLENESKMCNYSDYIEKVGVKKGIQQGKAEALVNLMDSLKLSIEQALNSLKIPESEWDDYRKLVADLEAHPVG